MALAGVLADLPQDCTPDQACQDLLEAMRRDGQDDDVALLVVRLDR